MIFFSGLDKKCNEFLGLLSDLNDESGLAEKQN